MPFTLPSRPARSCTSRSSTSQFGSRTSSRGSRPWYRSRRACRWSAARAPGRLVGGNLALVQQTIGTPYEIDTTDAILFLGGGTRPDVVRGRSGSSSSALPVRPARRGIVSVILSPIARKMTSSRTSCSIWLADLGVPVLMDFPAGHDAEPHPADRHRGRTHRRRGERWVYREDALEVPTPLRRARRAYPRDPPGLRRGTRLPVGTGALGLLLEVLALAFVSLARPSIRCWSAAAPPYSERPTSTGSCP